MDGRDGRFAGSVAWFLFAAAAARITASMGGLLLYFEFAVTFAIGVVFLGERPSFTAYVGTGLILLAMLAGVIGNQAATPKRYASGTNRRVACKRLSSFEGSSLVRDRPLSRYHSLPTSFILAVLAVLFVEPNIGATESWIQGDSFQTTEHKEIEKELPEVSVVKIRGVKDSAVR